MAVTTVTSTAALLEPRLVHAGINVVNVKYVHAGTHGDVILMAKLPTGVDVIGVYGKITTAQTAANATVGGAAGGLASNALAQFGSLASGASPVFSALGSTKYRVSLSDDATTRYTYLSVSPTTATWTISATIDLTVMYAAINQS